MKPLKKKYKKNKEGLTTHYSSMKIYQIIFCLARKEFKVYKRILLKSTDNKSFQHLCYKRNIIRKVLLEKLKEWEKDKSLDNMAYLNHDRTELGFIDDEM